MTAAARHDSIIRVSRGAAAELRKRAKANRTTVVRVVDGLLGLRPSVETRLEARAVGTTGIEIGVTTMPGPKGPVLGGRTKTMAKARAEVRARRTAVAPAASRPLPASPAGPGLCAHCPHPVRAHEVGKGATRARCGTCGCRAMTAAVWEAAMGAAR